MASDLSKRAIEKLRGTPLLAQLSDAQFAWLAARAELIDLELGEIFKCASDDALAVLVDGNLRLIIQDERNHEMTLCVFKSAGTFWTAQMLAALSSSSPSLRASENSSVMRISKALLLELTKQNPGIVSCLEKESAVFGAFSMLKKTARFAVCDFNALRPYLLKAERRKYASGESFAPGSGNEISILLSGSVEAELNGAPCRLKAGDWFSQARVLPGQSSFYRNLKAVEPGEAIVISGSVIRELKEFQADTASIIESLLLKEPGTDINERAADLITRLPAPEISGTEELAAETGLGPKIRRAFRRYPIAYQRNSLECGITCLHMICLFFGKQVSISQLREMCAIGRSGTSMLELADAAEQLGLFCRGVRTTYGGLMKLKTPLICHWKQNHFVVLYEINATHALIGDPAAGLEKIERSIFTRDFSNHALELLPSTEFGEEIKSKPFIGTFRPLLTPHMALARDMLLSGFVYQLLMLAVPIFTQVILDQVIVHQDLSMLSVLLIGMLLVTLFQTAMGFIREFVLDYLALKIDLALFSELFKKLLSLPYSFFDKYCTGDLLTRFRESSGVVQFFAGQGAMALLDLVMAFVFLVLIYCYDIKFGLAITAYAFTLASVVAAYLPTLKRLGRKAYDKQIAADSFLIEAIRGIERVKAAAAERKIRWKWELLFVDRLNVRFQELLANTTLSSIVRFLQVAGQAGVLCLGAQMVVAKTLSIGQLVAINMLVSMIANPFIRIAELAYAFQNVSVALEGLSDVLLEKPEEESPLAKIHVGKVGGQMKFENVSYRYAGRESGNALSNVSFEIKPGQMVGIVGRTGSGKTTLLRLIQGLYQPSEGRISVDGHDLSRVALSSYRQNIGVVSQNDYYFRGTIRENIAFYKPDASMEEIVRACTISGADQFISSLPSAYETVLTEGAANFSGGQRQCMAVARAILHEPAILIFDEATSNMDSETESRIQHSMERLRKQSTMLVVAHRLSTVRMADLLLVIDKGRIVESGTHESLLQERGLYYYFCQQQAQV